MKPDVTDEVLLQAIQEGDGAAFAVLVRRHSHKFFGLAYRILRQREAAEDVVQEAFLKLWRDPFAWDASRQARFTTWFYRVVVNRCLDSRRQAPELADAIPERIDESANAEEKLMQKESDAQLAHAIEKMPPRQRAVLQLVYYDGLPQSEAASIMGMKQKAFESLVFRARQTLRMVMAGESRRDHFFSIQTPATVETNGLEKKYGR